MVGNFPSLRSLKKLKLPDDDIREVVLIQHDKDSVLPLIKNAAQDAISRISAMRGGLISSIQVNFKFNIL